MRIANRLLPLAACLLASSAMAQTPIFIEFGNNSQASDLTTINGDIVVVGTNSLGHAFRWTYSSGVMTDIGPVVTPPSVSRDGTVICATTTGSDGQDRAARWVAGTWTQSPGLGGASGTSESTGAAISGNGDTITGLGWVSANEAHCLQWSQTLGIHDLGTSPNPSSRGNAVNLDGSFIAGFHDDSTGMRQGAYWINGVEQPALDWFDPSTSTTNPLGAVASVNSDGTIMVGRYFYNATTIPPGSSGWRWDAATGIIELPNLPGETDQANPVDISDDGSLAVGDNGWDPWFSFSWLQSVIWVNNVPQSLYGWASAQGTSGLAPYTDLGWPAAISANGAAICGSGGGFMAPGTPTGGWVLILPQAFETGTSICDPGTAGVVACPCSNPPAGSGLGCNNSSNTGGAHITATGPASLAFDGVTLITSGERPTAPTIVLQGSAQHPTGFAFGQGVRCITGILKRMYIKTASGGSITAPSGLDLSLSARSASLGDPITAGSHRYYGAYYRDPIMLGGCPASNGYNITQQLDVVWMP